jgi:large subunit ribosomal protein L13
MRTFIPKPSDVNKKWYVVDVAGKTFGRQVGKIARVLSGKNKPIYTPHIDVGDYVIIVNASKIEISGNKRTEKQYLHYTGYPGGLRSKSFQHYLNHTPDRLFRNAVWGMLPKNRLGRKMLKKLFVYEGSEHPHKAQKPESLTLGS